MSEILREREGVDSMKRKKRRKWGFPFPFSCYLPLDLLNAGQDKDTASSYHDWGAPAET